MADDRDRAFSEYYTARSVSMRATAYLLCGDWQLADLRAGVGAAVH